MAYGNQGGGGDYKQKFQGNWSCGKCGASITELPFEPKPDRLGDLKCFDCHKKTRESRDNSGPREMHEGNWACSMCGKAITKLPFKPNSTEGLKCVDCFRAGRN
jgi:CxxC-x17-CxxC domain-containing protein